MKSPEAFYIGWEAKSAPAIGKPVRRVVVVLVLLVVAVAAVVAASQRTIGVSVFEWGNLKTFSGVFEAEPYPRLLVARTNQVPNETGIATYYLVATWKNGLAPEAIRAFDGKSVTLKGTLIYRAEQQMIETKPEWIQLNGEAPVATPPGPIALGRQTLSGEIVDSKCYLGVMNPGQYVPHRACAIRCISGGCPPLLVVKSTAGAPAHLFLVSAEGKPVNQEVLDFVAEPVKITGEVVRQGDMLIFKADPKTYQRTR